MRVHAIQTGRVKIKASQVVGRGHGLMRQFAPLIDSEWSAWLPTFAYAIEHRTMRPHGTPRKCWRFRV
jgi:N-acyl homoserine lactone hydrolase